MSRMEWNDAWTVRPVTLEDACGAADLFNARSMHFYGENQSSTDDVLLWLQMPRFSLEEDSLGVFDVSGRQLAMAHCVNPGEPYVSIGGNVAAHPDVFDCEDLWDRLYGWVVERARQLLPHSDPKLRVALNEAVMENDSSRRAAAERAGFGAVRVSNRMGIDLDREFPQPEWPEGILVGTAEEKVSLASIVEASREAFRDHWGDVEDPFEQELGEWQAWVDGLGDAHDPSIWFLAFDGSSLAGQALFLTEYAGDSSRSYLERLSVRPAYRKQGIALALMRHGFRELAARGYKRVLLDTDSENLTGASRLYERAGLCVLRKSICYELEFREGEDIVKRSL